MKTFTGNPLVLSLNESVRRVAAEVALKTAQRASLAELDALFATLQHRAFKGELTTQDSPPRKSS